MKSKLKKGIYCLVIILLLSGCRSETKLKEAPIYESNSSTDKLIYQNNDGYKLFYGSWEYEEVVSQHKRIGGDENYNNLIGKKLTYHPEYQERW